MDFKALQNKLKINRKDNPFSLPNDEHLKLKISKNFFARPYEISQNGSSKQIFATHTKEITAPGK